jgi:hypothetical protein
MSVVTDICSWKCPMRNLAFAFRTHQEYLLRRCEIRSFIHAKDLELMEYFNLSSEGPHKSKVVLQICLHDITID